MDLASLQAFVKVVQTGSFTRAAEALHTQKARLSRVVTFAMWSLGCKRGSIPTSLPSPATLVSM